MKGAIVKEVGRGFVIADLTLDEPRGHEVLLEVKAVGLCHSDLTMSASELGISLPMTLGHEVSGVVVALGPDVSDVAVGDHVVGCLVRYCGRCLKCLSGKVYQCLRPESCLRDIDEPARITFEGAPVTQAFGLGGFAERALVHENQLVKVPDEVPFAQAALLGCAVVTGVGVVLNVAKVRVGESVVVVGVGGVGLNAISAARIVGASTIVAVDLFDEKLEKARAFGATHVVNSSQGSPVDEVLALTGGADAVFDFVGHTDVTGQALEMTGLGGGLYLIGVGGLSSRLDAPIVEIGRWQRRIQGVLMGSTTPKRDIPAYCDLYLSGRLNLDDLISRRITLDEINDGYASLSESSTARVVVTAF